MQPPAPASSRRGNAPALKVSVCYVRVRGYALDVRARLQTYAR